MPKKVRGERNAPPTATPFRLHGATKAYRGRTVLGPIDLGLPGALRAGEWICNGCLNNFYRDSPAFLNSTGLM